MKKLLFIIVLLIAQFSVAQGTAGDISGQVFEDSASTKPLLFAKVWVERGSSQFGTTTNEDGFFTIHAVPTGFYTLNINIAGDTLTHEVTAQVTAGGVTRLGRINLHEKTTIKRFKGANVVAFVDPLIKDVFGETNISSLEIKHSAAKTDIKQLIQSKSSEIQITPTGKMVVRGARPGDLVSYIDGVKMDEVKNIPSSAIGGITIFTSAIPASYGDTTGGVIIMETKSYYDLWQRWKIMMNLGN